jgi:hypothetical protein
MNKVLHVTNHDVYQDGGSEVYDFSDGFSFTIDNGLGSKTKGFFVKSLEDHTVINVLSKYFKAIHRYQSD